MASLFGKGGLFGGARAAGGPVEPGHFYRVNEHGEEFFSPTVAGQIIPNAPKSTGNGKGGDMHIHQQFNITTPDADSFGKSQHQLAGEMFRMAGQASSQI